MDDRTLTPEGDMDADAVDYSLSRRDVSAILFAVDREDREALLTLLEDMHPRLEAIETSLAALGIEKTY